MSGEATSTGVILFAHGSSVAEANRGVHELARRVEEAGPYAYVRAAFLECAQPDLGAAVAQAVQGGMRRLIVIPYFLTLGIHLRRDLPALVAAEKKKHAEFEIDVGEPLEGHPLMPSIILERVRAARSAK